MSRMIELQVLRPDDWRLWRELRLQALEESPAAFASTVAQWTGVGDTEERWRARLTDVPYNAVVRSEGAAVGMVGAVVRDDDTIELISMWVAPAARGSGVGDAAVQAVIDWAGPRDVLLSVKSDNTHAIALYQRHRFVDVGPSPDDSNERLMCRSTR